MYCRIHDEYHKGLVQKGICLFRIQENRKPKPKEMKDRKFKEQMRENGHYWNTTQEKQMRYNYWHNPKGKRTRNQNI